MKDDSSITVRDYWQKRYEKKFTIGASGHISFNERYNSFVYRAYERALKKALSRWVGARDRRVFDVGSGTGYWVDYYRKAGAADIFGVDLTDISIQRLTARYPEYTFKVADIGSADFIPEGRYDIVNCLDVLYYIIDDASFARALVSLASCLKPDGVLFITDTFRNASPAKPPFYYLHRDMRRYTEAMDAAGLVGEEIIPVNYLLKKPIPFPSVYSFIKWQLRKIHIDLEGMIGRLLYHLDPFFLSPDRSDIKLLVVSPKKQNDRA